MVRDPAYGLTPEALEYARQRYEKTDDWVSVIAADLHKSRATMYNIIRANGWQLRRDRPPQGLPQALKLDIEAADALDNKAPEAPDAGDRSANPDAPSDPVSVAARLEAALENELCKVESLRGEFGPRGKRSAEAERVARTLATLTETLFKVRRLRQPGGSQTADDDDLPSDPDGFRVALAHRIDVFVHSRADGSLAAANEPSDGEPAAS
jgi:hypothetical protein